MSNASCDVNTVSAWLQQWQKDVMTMLESHESTAKAQEEAWSYPHLGGGQGLTLCNGSLFEKAGVNFSHVHGDALPESANPDRKRLIGHPFEALGVSLVIHPENPFVPTTHANLRLFRSHAPEVEGQSNWWFGGGFDLTPYYGFEEDCREWHRLAKDACDLIDPSFYPRFKKECDDYFTLPHRQEQRGIGGLFFDDLNELDFDSCFAFIQKVGEAFIKAYDGIVARRKDTPWTGAHRAFQQQRRGRYVEFNLLYDRGTLFGLKTRGRTESILMSMPPTVSWKAMPPIEPGSEEDKLLNYYLVPRDWLAVPQLDQQGA